LEVANQLESQTEEVGSMANKDAINRVNCGGHCCSKRVGSIMLEAETNAWNGLIDPESLNSKHLPELPATL
jgi:hypothetical protein